MKKKISIIGYIHPTSVRILREFSDGLRDLSFDYSIQYWGEHIVKPNGKIDTGFKNFKKCRITITEINEALTHKSKINPKGE